MDKKIFYSFIVLFTVILIGGVSSCKKKSSDDNPPEPVINSLTFNVSDNFFPFEGFIVVHDLNGKLLATKEVNSDGTVEIKDLPPQTNVMFTIGKRLHFKGDEYYWKIESFYDVLLGQYNLVGNNESSSSLGKVKVVSNFFNLETADVITSIPNEYRRRAQTDSTQQTSSFDVKILSKNPNANFKILSLAVNEEKNLGAYKWIEDNFSDGQVYDFTLTTPLERLQVFPPAGITISDVEISSRNNIESDDVNRLEFRHYMKNMEGSTPIVNLYYAKIDPLSYYITKFTHGYDDNGYQQSNYYTLGKPVDQVDYNGSTVTATYNSSTKQVEDIDVTVINASNYIKTGWVIEELEGYQWNFFSRPNLDTHSLPELPKDILDLLELSDQNGFYSVAIVTGFFSDTPEYENYIKNRFHSSQDVTYDKEEYIDYYFFSTDALKMYKKH
ncbi:MAG: hypothetical protein ACEPOV_05400 [Hyphomicrobiales bacterium]